MADGRKQQESEGCKWALDKRKTRTFLELNGGFICTNHVRKQHVSTPRLDRYLPDTQDSTLDLRRQTPTRHSTSDIMVESSGRRTERKPRTSSNSEDQVVPQLENRRDDKDDIDVNPRSAA